MLPKYLHTQVKEMTEERKEELKLLLEEAMQSLIIEASERYKPISLERYKESAKAFRESYRPDLSFIFDYQLNIQDDTVKSKLFNLIKEELADYIRQNESAKPPWTYSICPANLAIRGTNILPCPLDSLLEKLLDISIASGMDRAILALDKCTRETVGTFQKIVLLQGPVYDPEFDSERKDRREIRVFDGIRLALFPLNASKLPSYLFDQSFSHVLKNAGPSVFRWKTVLIIDHTISPLFSKSPTENENQFEIKTKSTEFPNFDVEKFCQAFSLVSDYPVEPVRQWSYIDQDELFNLQKSLPIIVHNLFIPKEISRVTIIDETHIEKIKDRYKELVNLPSEVGEKLQIPIDRWIQSKTEDNPIDKIVDLGIALEALYLSEGTKEQLTLQFRLRAAWHLGENKEQRKALMKEFKAIYEWRSAVVHTGKLPKKGKGKKKKSYTQEEVREFIRNAQDLCRDSIMKILEDGQFPDWNNLILG